MAQHPSLYAVPPADFIGARNALAKELRAAGKDEEAAHVQGLRKPPAALWVVNQLGRLARKDVDALIEAAAGMKKAHAKGDGDALREAMREQREALQRLSGAAEKAAGEIGARVSPELQRRVQNTAQAAASADPDAFREGALEDELEPGGFDALLGTRVGAPKARPPPEKPSRATAKEEERERRRKAAELEEAEQNARRLRAHADKLQEKADQAREAAAEARRAADDAAGRAMQLRRDQ